MYKTIIKILMVITVLFYFMFLTGCAATSRLQYDMDKLEYQNQQLRNKNSSLSNKINKLNTNIKDIRQEQQKLTQKNQNLSNTIIKMNYDKKELEKVVKYAYGRIYPPPPLKDSKIINLKIDCKEQVFTKVLINGQKVKNYDNKKTTYILTEEEIANSDKPGFVRVDIFGLKGKLRNKYKDTTIYFPVDKLIENKASLIKIDLFRRLSNASKTVIAALAKIINTVAEYQETKEILVLNNIDDFGAFALLPIVAEEFPLLDNDELAKAVDIFKENLSLDEHKNIEIGIETILKLYPVILTIKELNDPYSKLTEEDKAWKRRNIVNSCHTIFMDIIKLIEANQKFKEFVH